MKNCSLWEGPTLKKVVEDSLPWEGPHAVAGEEHDEEGATETASDELTPVPIPLHLWQGRMERKLGVKLRPGRRRGGRRVF